MRKLAAVTRVRLFRFMTVALLLFVGNANVGYAANYYTKVGAVFADLSLLSSWTDDPTGVAGAAPPAGAFAVSGHTWNVFYGTTPSLGAAWAVAAGSTVVIGNGTDPIMFTIPAAFAMTGTVNVSAKGTLEVINATSPTLGVLNATSHLILGGTTAKAFPVSTGGNYGSVTCNNTSVISISAGTYNFAGNLRLIGAGASGTNGVVNCTGAGTITMNIAGNFTMANSATLNGASSGAMGVTINVGGNDTITNAAYITNTFTYGPVITLNNTSSSIANPQIMVCNSSYLSSWNSYIIAAGCVASARGQYNAPQNAATLAGLQAGIAVNGTLIVDDGGNLVYDQTLSDIFVVNPGGTLITAQPNGINTTIGNTIAGFASIILNSGANYVFNGTAAQVTGASFAARLSTPSTITSGGSITCNNTAGLTPSGALTFQSGASMKLQKGMVTTTPALTFNTGSNVIVDAGGFSATPATLTTNNVHLSYANLGQNQTSFSTTNLEWPTTFPGDVTINYPGATIGLNTSKSITGPLASGYGGLLLTAGKLSAGTSTISLTGNFVNNASATAFDAGTGTVSFDGISTQSLGGTSATTFKTLAINNTTGVNLNTATTFLSGATVQLRDGAFNLTSALTMNSGSNVVRDNGTFSVTPGTYSGVNLSYADLGANASPVTGNEWPASFTGNVTINKAGSVTLNATKTGLTGSMTLLAGNFILNNFSLSLTGNWTNNGGTFTPGTGTITLNGSSVQTIDGTIATAFSNLTFSNAAGVSLGQNASVTDVLALGNTVLTTGSNIMTTPSAAGSVTRGTGYVFGNLRKLLSGGITTLNYEIGDANYAPVSLLFNTGATGGSITAKVAHGNHPNLGSSGIDGILNVAHYWNISASSPTGFTTVSPTFSYQPSDIGGGNNSTFVAQNYSSGTWGALITGATNPTSTSTTVPATASYTGEFVVGKHPVLVPPTLTPNFDPPTVDNLGDGSHSILFTDDGTWAANIVSITVQRVGSPVISTLTAGVDYTISGPLGKLTLIPHGAGHTYLDTAGIYAVSVYSSGYTGATVQQVVNNGAPNKLVMSVQPAGPLANGGLLGTQPVVKIVDQYGNATLSSLLVTAAVGSGAWTIGGASLSFAAVTGTATFSGLTATSLGAVTGATITFSAPGLTSVTSAGFNIPAPDAPTLNANTTPPTVDNLASLPITFTDNPTWRAAITSVTAQLGAGPVNTLQLGVDYTITAGVLTLIPNLTHLYLTTPGVYTITVNATGYNATSTLQTVLTGNATKLGISVQPTAPGYNGGTLATQPVIVVQDQYGNTVTTSTALINAAIGAGAWTLGGPSLSATSVAGVATFADLTATSLAGVTGATITFSSSGLTSVTSAPFNIPNPPTTYYNVTGTGVNLADVNNWGLNADGSGAHPSNFTTAGQAFKIVNGSNPTIASAWAVSGLGSYVIVGDGNNPMNFIVPTTFAFTGIVNVTANATLSLGNVTLPTFGTLSTLSTVNFNGNATQAIPNTVTYGNLTYSGTSIGNFPTGVMNVMGNFTISSGTVRYPLGAVFTMNVYKNFNVTGGTIDFASTSTAAFSTLNVYGNMNLSGGSYQSTAATIRTNLWGNFTRSGSSTITGGAFFLGFRFNNTATSLTNPQRFAVYNTSGTTFAVQFMVQPGVFVQVDTNWVTTSVNALWTVFDGGTLNFRKFVESGPGQIVVNANGTFVTAHPNGVNGSITVTGTKTFAVGSNYVFNSDVPQVTGTFMPTSFTSGSYIRVDNSGGGVTLTNTTSFASGSSVRLQNGTLINTAANLVMNTGSTLMVDNGALAVTPTTYSAGANLTYTNLGNNNLSVTTANEWPASFGAGATGGNVTIDKPGATISLNSAKTLASTTGVLTVNAGSLDVTAGNYGITTAGSWVNNAGAGGFNARGGEVIFNGSSAQVIGGTSGTTFNTLSIASPGGVTLSAATTFASGKTLNLISGTFANGTNLSMASGSNVVRDAGLFTATPSVYSGVNLTYANLGASASPGTSLEWPASFTGNVTINKPGPLSVILDAGRAVTGNITLTAGTLMTINFPLSLTGNWTNNASATALTPGTTSVTFNGSSAQTIGGTFTTPFSGVTINNAAGVNLGINTALTGVLTLTNGVLSTGANTLTVPGAAANVVRTASTSSNYVFGNLSKSVTGLGQSSPINFEVGDVNYAPVSIATNTDITGGGNIIVRSTSGAHPQYASSGIDGTFRVNHYWTFATSGTVGGFTTITPTFTYNNADIGGGSNTAPSPWKAQRYNGSGWDAVIVAATDPTGNTTVVPTTPASFAGDYIVGLNNTTVPPTLTPNVTPNMDNVSDGLHSITYTDDAFWRTHITLVTARQPGGAVVTLTNNFDFTVTAGKLTLAPTLVNSYLTTAGTYTLSISSIGYLTATVVQTINAGAAAQLSILTQPVGPLTNGGPLTVQPVIGIKDQFGNTAGSAATITATTGAGAWTPGGNTTASGTGSATFSGLTASSLGPVTGATITFTSGALTPVTSIGFNIGAPNPPTLTAAAGVTVDNPFNITYTDNATWRAAITGVKIGGVSLPPAAFSTSAGVLTLTPAASSLLQSVGTKAVTVQATGYIDAAVSQPIGAGAAATLAMSVQPAAPAFNGAVLATQPVVLIRDQYGNATTSTALVTASVGAGTWTLGGTLAVPGVAGVVSYTNLSATSATAVAGATITFTINGLLGIRTVTSGAFNIPNPPINYYDKTGAGLDLSNVNNWTTSPTGVGGTSPSNFTSGLQHFIIKNGTNPTIGAAWAVSGLGSYVTVGDGAAVTFNIPAGFAMTGNVDVAANATLNITNTTIPTLGVLAGTSTVVFNAAVAQLIPINSYGNLTYAGTSTGTMATGTINVAGNLRVSSGTLTSAGSETVNVTGNLITEGNGVLSSAGTQTINLNGNLSVTGTSTINSTGSNAIKFANNTSTIGAPQTITWTTSNTGGTNTTFTVNSGVVTALSTSMPLDAATVLLVVNGTLNFGLNTVTGTGTFVVNSGGTVYTANTTGLTGSVLSTGTLVMSAGANYVFNAASNITNPWLASQNWTTTSAPANVTLSNGVTMTSNVSFSPSGVLTISSASGILNMGTAVLGGAFTVANSGIIRTQNTSATPVPSGKTWNGNVTYDGATAQTVMAGTYGTLTLNNTAGGTLSGNVIASTLTFTDGILNTGANTMTVNTLVNNAGTGKFVNGTLIKPITGLTNINYEVGDAAGYAPMSLALSSAGTSGSMGVMVTNGLEPNFATSGLSNVFYTNHYWTVSNIGAAGPATITPTATYNVGDILGGVGNSAFLTQRYGGGAWLGAPLATTNTVSPYTSKPNSGISLASAAGNYVFATLPCTPPTPTFTVAADVTSCVNTNVTYATQPGFTNYVWNLTGSEGTTYNIVSGGTGTASNSVTVQWLTAGAKTVTVIYNEGVCVGTGTASNTTTVLVPPVAIVGNTQICAGGSTLMLSNASAGGTWSSNNVSAATINTNSGEITSGVQGTAQITYSNGCGSAATITATVNAAPAAITGNAQMCANGSTITLSNSSTNGTWSGGTAGVATVDVNSGVVTPGANQNTTTISYSNGCGSAASITATVNAAPAAISNNSMMCAGGSTITLGNTSTNGTWSSATLAVASVDVNSGMVTTGVQGTTVISYANGCGSAASVTATVNATPAATTGNAQMCAGGSNVTLANTSTNGTWSSNNTSVATVDMMTGVMTSGVQGTALISYDNGCGVAAVVTATVNAAPAPIGGNMWLCAGGNTMTLTNTSTNGTWTGGSTSVATINANSGLVTSNGQGTTMFSYSNGCGSAASVTTTVNATPAAIGGNTPLCASGFTTTLTNTATNGTWSSSNPAVASINMTTGSLTTGAVDGTTTITYDNGCSPAATATFTVNPLPTIHTFTGGGGYCIGGTGVSIGLTLSTTGVNYQLFQGVTPMSAIIGGTGSPITFGTSYLGAGYYYAIATDVATGCTSTLPGVTVHINPLPDVFNVTGGGSYCSSGGAGVAVGLDSSIVGIDYQLYDASSALVATTSGTGSAISFGLQPAGVYTAKAVNTATGCEIDMNGSATVDFYPSPTVHNVLGGGTYCLGGSGVNVSLDGSDLGIDYQLIYGGFIPIGGAVDGTGTGLDMGDHFLPGDYTVIARDTTTGCTDTMAGDAQINFALPPTPYFVGGGGGFCAGDAGVNITLSGSQTDVSYQLMLAGTPVGSPVTGTGSALDFGLFTTPGNYTVVATNPSTGCTLDMLFSATVSVNPVVIPTVSLNTGVGTDNRVCYGNPITFTAVTTNGGATPTYEWKINNITVPGTDNYTYVPTDGDIVWVRMTSSTACAIPSQAMDTMYVDVDTMATPSVFITVDPITSVPTGTTVTFTAHVTNGGPAPAFQWFKNGTLIAGANTSVYTTNSLVNRDSIMVVVTTSGGCGGMVTVNGVRVTVYGVGVPTTNVKVSDVRLVPNPNKGTFSVTGTLSTTEDAEVSLDIVNMLGQSVYTGKVTAKAGVINTQIQMTGNLANGMYMLNLQSGDDRKVFHFVLEQ